MGTIRNRLLIVHDYDYDRITETRKHAISYFQKAVLHEELLPYDVESEMVSPILRSLVNDEFTFVIMGDCSKLGWETSQNFETYRQEWIKQIKDSCQNILVADFGEGDNKAFITEF